MTRLILIAVVALTLSCRPARTEAHVADATRAGDSLALAQMIAVRERAMIDKNLPLALAQFADDATWVNSQGYYFAGKEEVAKFHAMLAGNDSLDYFYQAGTPLIRVIDGETALAYYSWKMFWYRKAAPADTVTREIGLMTLLARKEHGAWRWIAVTNQHTPDFYERIEPVNMD